MQAFLLSKGLTYAEAAVVIWTAKGMTNKEVGDTLGIKDKTVKFHLTNIYKKLGVKNRTQMIVYLLPLLTIVTPPIMETTHGVV